MVLAKVSILIIGNPDHPEFHAARDVLQAVGTVRVCGSVEHATNWLYAASPPPDWIMVFQSLPGEFSRKMLDMLWRLAPLARIVRILGSWCEGEQRTGQPWPGTPRIYWHHAPARLRAELSAPNGAAAWQFAGTMSDEDRLLAARQLALQGSKYLIGIHARTMSHAESIADVCSAHGWSAVWLQPGRPVFVRGLKACVFDAAHSSDSEFKELSRTNVQLPGVPVVALLNFPRLEDELRARYAGATAVLSKPLLMHDLLHTLQQVGDLQSQSTIAGRSRAG